MPETKYPGTEITLGDKSYVVPAISLGKLKLLQPRLGKLNLGSGGMPSPEDLDTVIDMTLAAVKRNYPDAQREDLEDEIDIRNMKMVVEAVMGQSGLTPSGKPTLEGTPSP